jgi:hypothetical protein
MTIIDLISPKLFNKLYKFLGSQSYLGKLENNSTFDSFTFLIVTLISSVLFKFAPFYVRNKLSLYLTT